MHSADTPDKPVTPAQPQRELLDWYKEGWDERYMYDPTTGRLVPIHATKQ